MRLKIAAEEKMGLLWNQLESALKGGHYRPDAQRIADQILSAAEVDARLRAMMQKG